MEKTRDLRTILGRSVIGGLFCLAAFSQAKLQTFDRENTIELANNTRRFEITQVDPAERGSILSADGKVLAKDERVYDLTVVPKDCPDAQGFWLDLASASGIPACEFAFGKSKSRTWPGAVSDDERSQIDKVRQRWHTSGISVRSSGVRAYPLEADTACLVGIIRRQGMTVEPGKPGYETAVREYGAPKPGHAAVADLVTGLEESQDSALRGTDGRRVGLADKSGRLLPMRSQVIETPRKDGKNITLTIDSSLQTLAAASVKKAVEDSKADSGVAIVEDPSNGNLLAVANWPSFTPYNPDGSPAPMDSHGGLNQAYMSCMEPGSMFKILTLAKALDTGVITMNSKFYCPGEKEVVPGAKPIKCDLHNGNRAHGAIDPVLAIARSCNIWAATWAYQIGYSRFVSYLTDLGLLDRPDLGVPGEVKALFNRHDPAKNLQIANVGFGQSINCTPVALVGAFSTIANGGVRVKPRLIAKVGDEFLPAEPGKRLLSNAACDGVIKGMIAVFENPHGTGYALRMPGYELAGKTGTAQKIGKNSHGHVSNFVGFIPAVHPRAVVLVMVDNPKKQYYGAEVAGPVFKTLAAQIIRKYRIPRTPVVASVAAPVSHA